MELLAELARCRPRGRRLLAAMRDVGAIAERAVRSVVAREGWRCPLLRRSAGSRARAAGRPRVPGATDTNLPMLGGHGGLPFQDARPGSASPPRRRWCRRGRPSSAGTPRVNSNVTPGAGGKPITRGDDAVSVEEAAELFGCSVDRVMSLAATGRVRRLRGTWPPRFRRRDVEEFLAGSDATAAPRPPSFPGGGSRRRCGPPRHGDRGPHPGHQPSPAQGPDRVGRPRDDGVDTEAAARRSGRAARAAPPAARRPRPPG